MLEQSDKHIIALTGGIASGKSTVCDIFSELGISIIDADVAAREVVKPGTEGLEAVVEHFGESVLNKSTMPHQLDRQKLREIIFTDPEERQWLETCLHPKIRQWMYAQTELAESAYVIHAIPLLIETGLYQQYRDIIVIDVPEAVQIERLMSRDQCSKEAAQNILKSQASRSKRNPYATYVLKNTKSLVDLVNSVKSLHNQILQSINQI